MICQVQRGCRWDVSPLQHRYGRYCSLWIDINVDRDITVVVGWRSFAFFPVNNPHDSGAGKREVTTPVRQSPLGILTQGCINNLKYVLQR